MIVRVLSPEHGTKRIDVKENDHFNVLLDKVQEEFLLTKGSFSLARDRKGIEEIRAGKDRTVKMCNLRHGDMVYLVNRNRDAAATVNKGDDSMATVPKNGPTTNSAAAIVVEDAVDVELAKCDGRIYRKKDAQYCRHGASGRCVHCAPLEPYDNNYLAQLDPPVKLLSFHAYIRKLQGGADKGKFLSLENLSCRIRPGCTEHAPWPEGICTKCQPNAVTLSRQAYRHVDYVQLENAGLVEDFLDFWRRTGAQRVGFLYGRYEAHDALPLGIKAVVTAIYEPPQECSKARVQLLPDPAEALVAQLAAELGMRCVGWIFTDLAAEDLRAGTVRHFRGTAETHFLSAQEVLTAAAFQQRFPNACQLSGEGQFGSKFVTVVATGDKDGHIHFEGFQVSNQAMALARDDCLVPTYDAPELAYVRESSVTQYIPDVFYSEKDSYGNEVTRLGRPLPVAYLLVDMPCAFPLQPHFTFPRPSAAEPFPLANRADWPAAGGAQDFSALARYFRQFEDQPTPQRMLEAFTSFHLLVYLASDDMLHLGGSAALAQLVNAVLERDADRVYDWTKCEQWQMARELMDHVAADFTPAASSKPTSSATASGVGSSAASPTDNQQRLERETSFVGKNAQPLPPIGVRADGFEPMSMDDDVGAGAGAWTCPHCTFSNSSPGESCGMCALPRS